MADFQLQYERLTQIAKAIQKDNLTLEQVHALYKEGNAVAAWCESQIAEMMRNDDDTAD